MKNQLLFHHYCFYLYHHCYLHYYNCNHLNDEVDNTIIIKYIIYIINLHHNKQLIQQLHYLYLQFVV
jgi:hypothetical protein